MSNYLVVITPSRRARRIADWMLALTQTAADEVVVRPVSADMSLIYVAKKAADDLLPHGIFKGFATDFSHKQLIFGAAGYAECRPGQSPEPLADSPIEGCYLSVCWNERSMQISHDAFGFCALNYFEEGSVVAASDSVFILTELRKFLSLPCRIDAFALVPRARACWKPRWRSVS